MSEGLDFRVAPIVFDKGLDTRTQRKLVVAGKWDTLINVSLSENGSLKRRDGFEAVLDGRAGNGLATHDNQLLIVDGPKVSTVSLASTPATGPSVSGFIGNVDVAKTEIFRQDGTQDQPDVAFGNGLICYVWRQRTLATGATAGLRCTIVDATTGAHLLDSSTIDSTTGAGAAISPRVVFADNCFFIFYIIGVGAGTALTCRVIATSAPGTVGAAVALITSVNLVRLNFDAVGFPADAVATVLYGWGDGVDSGRAIGVGQALTVPSIGLGPIQIFSEASVPFATIEAFAVAVYSSSTDAGCFVQSSTVGVFGTVIDDTFAVTTVAGGQVISPVVGVTLGPCHLCATQDGANLRLFRDFSSEHGTNAINQIVAQVVTTALATFAGPTNVVPQLTYGGANNPLGPEGPFIYGKAFTSNSRVYLPVFIAELYNFTATVGNALQNSIFLLDTGPTGTNISAGVVVAKALYGSYGLAVQAWDAATPCSTPSIGTGVFVMQAQERTTLSLFSGGILSPTGVVSLEFRPNFTVPPLRFQFGESTYFAGGSVAAFDGVAVAEHGFPLFPEGIIAAAIAGGSCTDGVHVLAATYEWTDAAGDVHSSAVSPVQSVTCGAGNNIVRVRVPTLVLSQKPNITISVWMTVASGTTLLLASQLTANDTTVPFVTINVNIADAALAGNKPLYSQPLQPGTSLPNVAPNPMHGLGPSQNRVWGFLSDERGEFAYSQELTANVGLRFNADTLNGRIPSEAGEGVIIAELDEKTVLFCERGLWVVYGTGPTASGGFNNFSKPQRVPSDVGCSEARSVVAVPPGIIFKSEKGWHLLGRDLSVRFIGDGVERYNAEDVSSAVMIADRQEVRFGSVSGPTLVYSYLEDAWSVFYMGNLLHAGSVADAAWWPATQKFVHLQASTGIFPGLMQDTPGVYVDGSGTASPLQAFIFARTAFLHVSALAGFQRVRHLYLTTEAAAAPTTSLVIGADFDGMYTGSPGAYTTTVALGGVTFPSVEAIDLRHKLARQKCSSVAFSFLENSVGTSTLVPITGYQALAVEVGLKRGVNRLPAGQNAG